MTKDQKIELIREAVSMSAFMNDLTQKDLDTIFAICSPWVKLKESSRLQNEIKERQDLLNEINKLEAK